MPYRAAIESVHARCDELRARIEKLQHVPVAFERCATIDDAIAWEARLRALATTLEANRAAEEDFAPTVSDPSDVEAWRPPSPKPIHVFVGAAVAVATIVIFAIQLRPSKTPPAPPQFALMAANVVSERHHDDRCTVRVDRDGDACDVDIICPSTEKRLHEPRCAAHDHFSFTTDGGESFEIELDAWR